MLDPPPTKASARLTTTTTVVQAMKRGKSNRFAMSFRKAGSQETYTPGSASSSSSSSSATATAAEARVQRAAPPAKKKSRFADVDDAAVDTGAAESTQGR